MKRNRTISLCVTTFNRVDMTLQSFAKVYDDPRVGEIVILDDGSEPESRTQLMECCVGLEKVQYFGSSDNKGVYTAKKNAVSLAYHPWIILLDSDNRIDTDYLDALYALPEWEPSTSYLPAFAKPAFDYRHFAGLTLSKENVGEHLLDRQFDCLINTMNGFYNKRAYLTVFDEQREPLTADSMYMNYLFLKMGYKLHVVPGLEYEHPIHEGSHYKQHSHRNIAFRNELFDQYKQLH